jgi:hypothetical protein
MTFSPSRPAIALALLAGLLVGCVHGPQPADSDAGLGRGSGPLPILAGIDACANYLVAFPPVALATDEFIESCELEIFGGRVVAINRFFDDWDLQVTWDNPTRLWVSGQARHFSAGLADVAPFANFITVQVNEDDVLGLGLGPGLGLEARLEVEACDREGSAGPRRMITIKGAEMILTPMPLGGGVR